MSKPEKTHEVAGAAFQLRRAGVHFTRPSARWGYVVLVFCILAYLLTNTFPKDWTETDNALREFFLVLASVAAGAIVLPELSSNLWSIDAQRVRRLIPSEQREELARTLIQAHSDDTRWTQLVWAKALDPLMNASHRTWEYTVDMSYEADVFLNRSLTVGDVVLPVHTVAVAQNSFRVLRREGVPRLWITIARTSSALRDEFEEPGCLARELVPMGDLVGVDWQKAIRTSCRVGVSIDGTPLELVADTTTGGADVVRWYLTPERELTSDRVRVDIRFDFYVSRDTDSFPVMFSGCYCAGITDISLRLHDDKQEHELECEHFMGRALDSASLPGTSRSDNSVYKQITFSTGRDSILWPGSGVMFRWRKTHERTH